MATAATIASLATAVMVLILLLIAQHYLPAYVREKGRNLATKEDIAEITNEIESVKGQHARELELLRAQLGSRSRIHEIRYEREFDVLQELNDKAGNAARSGGEPTSGGGLLRSEGDRGRAEETSA